MSEAAVRKTTSEDGVMQLTKSNLCLVAALAAVCLAAGCNIGGEKARTEKLVEKTQEYWPLDKGNEWEYEISGQGQREKKIWVMTVSAIKDVSLGKIATVVSHNKSAEGFRTEMDMAVTPGGIYEVRHANYGAAPTAATGPVKFVTEMPAIGVEPPYLYRSNPKVGDEWSFDFGLLVKQNNQFSGPFGTGKGKVEAVEDVTVPAGKFNATKISFKTYGVDGKVSDERLFWFAEGIGPVKLSSRGVSFNLKKATVKDGGVIGK